MVKFRCGILTCLINKNSSQQIFDLSSIQSDPILFGTIRMPPLGQSPLSTNKENVQKMCNNKMPKVLASMTIKKHIIIQICVVGIIKIESDI